MYCPKCGQGQVAEQPRFCSQCGLALHEVTDLLERGPIASRECEAPGARSVRKSAAMMALSVPIFFIAGLAGGNDLEGIPELLGLLAMVTFLIGASLTLQALVMKWRARRRTRSAAITSAFQPQLHAAPSSYIRTRFNTGEIPSITEHTTRHLDAL